jgi:methionyl-tRNA synthetase
MQDPEPVIPEPAPVPEPEPAVPAKISIDDLSKIEISIGTVRAVERVPETDKLLKCSVDFGEAGGPRTIVSGIAMYVPEPESLVGRQLAYVTNLAPRTIKGIESNGMLFAVGSGDTFAFLTPSKEVPPGTSAH